VFNRLKKKQLQRLNSTYQKILNSGITVNTARNFSIKQWNEAFNEGKRTIKTINSLKAAKRLLKQIENNQSKMVTHHVKWIEKKQQIPIKNKRYKRNLIKILTNETKRLFEFEEGTYKQKEITLKKKVERLSVKKNSKYRKTDKFYIKYNDEEDYRRQLAILESFYQVKSIKLRISKAKEKTYLEFEDRQKMLDEFEKGLE